MSGVTRSMQATTTRPARRVARRRRAQPNGWWGVLLLCATEAALFCALIASYFYLRFNAKAWPPPGVKPPELLAPCLLTAVLVATTIPILAASRGAVQGALPRIRAGLGLALFVQCGYLAYQLYDYVDELSKHQPSDSAYSSIYYTLLGAHHFHVAIGLLLSAALLIKLRSGLTNYRAVGVRAVALYWHFTNAAAVAVLLTQIYPSL